MAYKRNPTREEREAEYKALERSEKAQLDLADRSIETGKRLAVKHPHLADAMISGAGRQAEIYRNQAAFYRDKMRKILRG